MLVLKLLHPSEISNTGTLSDAPRLTGDHVQDSPCVVCGCTSVWHHRSGLGRRKRRQMLTCTDGAALRVMKTSHSKADIQWFFPARLSFSYPDFIRLAPHLPPHQYFFLPQSLISPVWIKISVRWPQTTFWLFDKFVFRGHFIVKSQNVRMFSQRYLLCTLLTTHTHRFWPQDAKQQVKILKKGLNSSLFPLKCKFQKTGQKRRTNAPHKTHVLTFYWQLWTDS